MSQSMNGLSLFSGNGITESDNISCNNIACNNLSSNIVATDNLTALQTNGTIANYTGLVSANKFTAPTIHADQKIDTDTFECRRLNSYEIVDGNQITCNRINCNINLVSTAIECGDLSANKIKNIRENCGLMQSVNNVENLLLGYNCGNSINGTSNSSYNIGVGNNCFTTEETGSFNVAIGFNSGQAPNQSGIGYSNSIALGKDATYDESNQIAIGNELHTTVIKGEVLCDKNIGCLTLTLGGSRVLTAQIMSNLENLTSNVQNQLDLISKDSGQNVTSGIGIQNVALGNLSLQACSTGGYNFSAGYNVLPQLQYGSGNISIGKDSGERVVGSDNICIGVESGQGVVGLVSNSVSIGAYSKFTKSNEIALGTSFHNVRIDGTISGPDIISKSKMKYGKHQAIINDLTTVFFTTAFPVGSLPFVQLTPIYTGNLTTLGVLYVYDYSNTYLTYGYLLNGVHQETSITVNWMATIA